MGISTTKSLQTLGLILVSYLVSYACTWIAKKSGITITSDVQNQIELALTAVLASAAHGILNWAKHNLVKN